MQQQQPSQQRDTTTLAELALIARSARPLAERQDEAANRHNMEEEEEKRLLSVEVPRDQNYGLSFDETQHDHAVPSVEDQLRVFDKPAAFLVPGAPAGPPVFNHAVDRSAEAVIQLIRRRKEFVHRMVWLYSMHMYIVLQRAKRKVRARYAAAGGECPVVAGPAMPIAVGFSANRVAALEGGENMGDREGRPEATDIDQRARGANDLGLKDFDYPVVTGRGALDLSRIPCAFGCEGCRESGFDMQTLAEVCEQCERTHKAGFPEATAAEVAAAGVEGVVRTINLIECGQQAAAVGSRVSCNWWRCMMASGILLEKDRAKWLAGKQYANFNNGNKRHGSKDLLLRNVRLVRKLFAAEVLTAEQVGTAMLDISQSTYWAETRQREFYGVATVLARSAQDMGYPLTGRDTKHAFLVRMGQVPHNFINTVMRDHVLSTSTSEGRRTKSWDTVLTDMLKQTFPDALTTAHADMLLRTWINYGKQRNDHGRPRHEIDKMDLEGGVKAALFEGAKGFHSVVAPFFKSAHQHKIRLMFDSAAARAAEGSDVFAAIQANAKCMGLTTAGQKAEFERFVSLHKNARERTTALIPVIGDDLDCPYAPADNVLRLAQNAVVLSRTVAALRCLNATVDPEEFAKSFLVPCKDKNNCNGWTIKAAVSVVDPFRSKCWAARQRREVFERNACAGYAVPLGVAPRLRAQTIKDFTTARGQMSGIGMRIYDPFEDELPEHVGEYVAVRVRDGPIPETLAKDVVRTHTLGERGAPRDAVQTMQFAMYGEVDEVALFNVDRNYTALVAEGVVDPARFSFDDYLLCDQKNFWETVNVRRNRVKQRWWEATQMHRETGLPGAWHCANPACVAAHGTEWSPRISDRTCACAESKSFAAYLKAHRMDAAHLWPNLTVEQDRFARQWKIRKQARVDQLKRIANRTEDDSEKLHKARTELAALRAKGAGATNRRVKELEKRISESKGVFSVELHAKAQNTLENVLPRILSRFVRGVVDEETKPLHDRFDKEVARFAGSNAQRSAHQYMHVTGADQSIYGGPDEKVAAMNAKEASALFGEPSARPAPVPVPVPAGESSDSDDSEVEDEGEKLTLSLRRQGARIDAAAQQQLAENEQDEALAAPVPVPVPTVGSSDSNDSEVEEVQGADSAYLLTDDAPLGAKRVAALLAETPRTNLRSDDKKQVRKAPSLADHSGGEKSKAKKPKATPLRKCVKQQLKRNLGQRAVEAVEAASPAPARKRVRWAAAAPLPDEVQPWSDDELKSGNETEEEDDCFWL